MLCYKLILSVLFQPFYNPFTECSWGKKCVKCIIWISQDLLYFQSIQVCFHQKMLMGTSIVIWMRWMQIWVFFHTLLLVVHFFRSEFEFKVLRHFSSNKSGSMSKNELVTQHIIILWMTRFPTIVCAVKVMLAFLKWRPF